MQQAADSSYQTMVTILAEMVKSFLSSTPSPVKPSKVSKFTSLRVSILLQREDEELADNELTAELLGTQEFKKIA
jgi:hypothetical protein